MAVITGAAILTVLSGILSATIMPVFNFTISVITTIFLFFRWIVDTMFKIFPPESKNRINLMVVFLFLILLFQAFMAWAFERLIVGLSW